LNQRLPTQEAKLAIKLGDWDRPEGASPKEEGVNHISIGPTPC